MSGADKNSMVNTRSVSEQKNNKDYTKKLQCISFLEKSGS